jgi:hypothetical protein
VDDSTLTAWVNEKAVQRTAERVNSDDLYELIDAAEFTALPEASQNEVWNILLLFAQTGVPTAAGTRARSRLVAIFGAGSTTINNVVAAITFQVSRATDADVGAETVREGDVQYARTLV